MTLYISYTLTKLTICPAKSKTRKMQPQAKVVTDKEQPCRVRKNPQIAQGGRTVQGRVHSGAGHRGKGRGREDGPRGAGNALSDKPLCSSVTAGPVRQPGRGSQMCSVCLGLDDLNCRLCRNTKLSLENLRGS